MRILKVLMMVFVFTFACSWSQASNQSVLALEAKDEEVSVKRSIWDIIGKLNPVKKREMQVHFIDVGQGDSMLIETPNGKTVLIDGGVPKSGKKLEKYLKNEGVTTIDLMVATHPDIDHIGGLIRVLKKFEVEKVLDSGKLYTTNTYFNFIKQINKRNIPVKVASEDGKVRIDPSLSIEVLNAHNMLKTNNQSSIVLRVSYGEVDFLLMGDAESMQEKELLKEEELQSEILKVGHHGSASSTSLAFLKEVQPDVSILSYSENNDYGHPVKKVVENLKKVGTTIFETAKSGDIIITTDGKNYRVESAVSGTTRFLSFFVENEVKEEF